MQGSARSWIRLCGSLEVVIDGRPVDPPARQGRLLLAYLVRRRGRHVDRRELADALWPPTADVNREAALRPLLSRLRTALGPGVLEGRKTISLEPPSGTEIDVDVAADALAEAEVAGSEERWGQAFEAASRTARITGASLLPGEQAAWIDDWRQELEDLHLAALELVATAGVRLRGPQLGAGERAARSLIARAPFREGGYRMLMEAHYARGNVAEAVLVYEVLRRLLRDELGLAPERALQRFHGNLLAQSPTPGG